MVIKNNGDDKNHGYNDKKAMVIMINNDGNDDKQ